MRLSLWFTLFLSAHLNAQVFMRPIDNAAALALGSATIAFPGIKTGFANDALLGMGERYGAFIGSALPYGITGWHNAYLQAFVRTSANDGLGLEVSHSAIEVYGEQRFRLQYGRRLGKLFLAGGSADVLWATAQEYGNATAFAFSLSVLANPLPKVWIGAKVQNPLQFKMGDDALPTVLRIGAAWEASETLIMLAEAEKDIDRSLQIKAGIAYHPVQLLTLRLGLRTEPARLGFGAGLRISSSLTVDTGAEWHPILGLTPAAMLVWRKQKN